MKSTEGNQNSTDTKTEYLEPSHLSQINFEPSKTNMGNNANHTELETILNQSAVTFQDEIQILKTEMGKENNRLIRTFNKN